MIISPPSSTTTGTAPHILIVMVLKLQMDLMLHSILWMGSILIIKKDFKTTYIEDVLNSKKCSVHGTFGTSF
jgi:hypothetical protein